MKKIPQIIATLKLVCIVALLASAFVWIWGDGDLAAKIAGTSVLGLVVLWFIQQVFRNVFEAIIKEQVQEKTAMKKSRWQEKIERIQAEKKQKESNAFITEELDKMLKDSKEE
jgi:uncharacterized membrane protein YhiD involved in acid resistance